MFRREGIRVLAISPDSEIVLCKFAEKYAITYPLLSDRDSRVIRQFGILNTYVPTDHEWYGIPYPGTYAVGRDGRVFDKSFIANHRIRESADNLLQESFQLGRSGRVRSQKVTTPHLTAEAYLASPTVRRGQLVVLTVEVALAGGLHVYGRPLPEGYIPIEMAVEGGDALSLTRIAYPETWEEMLDVGGERLPIYSGRLTIKAYGVAVNEDRPGKVEAAVRLRYQACDDRECFLPETVTFRLPLEILPHDWERLD